MDDKIQNKWDQFKSKEDEYLKMNEQIDARRKNIQDKMKKQQEQQQNEDVEQDQEGEGHNDDNDNEDDYQNDNQQYGEDGGENDEFGMNENQYNDDDDQDLDQEDYPKEFSNRDYINKIIDRVNKEDNDDNGYKQKKQQKQKKTYGYGDNEDEEAKDDDQDNQEQSDDDDINAENLLKKQEQLQEKLQKYKKIDSKKNEELLELEMMVEEQEKIIRVQRIRKDGLLGEIESLSDALKVKENTLSQLGEKGKTFEEETESYQIQINLLNDKMEETKKSIGQFGQQKQLEDKECKALQNEVEQVKKEIKKRGVELNKKDIKQRYSYNYIKDVIKVCFLKSNIRINRLQEEIDKIKMNLQLNKGTSASEKQGDAKKINEKLNSDIKKFDRQILELLSAFKKQLRLIDILKRQKNHLIAGQIFAYTEEQFVNAIEMGQKI